MSTPRYRPLGDGTIRDTDSGVYWMAVPLGIPETVWRRWPLPAGLRRRLDSLARWRPSGGAGPAGLYTWDEAVEAVAAFDRTGGYAGYRDWRLPTRGEIKRLLDPADGWPGQVGIGVDAPAGRFWTAQPHPAIPRYAWCVDVAGRACYLGRNARLHVWLARSGR